MDIISTFISTIIDMITFALAGFGLLSLAAIIWSEMKEEEA